ncbi:MAG: hypothetical protein JO019_01575 [Candidatus Kaiserbacteria bacterium]|nr:hypothetical protein [Candidatus Kaiserbacteria bacterium]
MAKGDKPAGAKGQRSRRGRFGADAQQWQGSEHLSAGEAAAELGMTAHHLSHMIDLGRDEVGPNGSLKLWT